MANILTGTAADDLLAGIDTADLITGLEGDDTLTGIGGNDTIDGGDDDDEIRGGEGDDSLLGGSGRDQMYGGDDNDEMSGGDHRDKMYGQDGDDTMSGDGGNDLLIGGNGDDVMSGGIGRDLLRGGIGNDDMSGGDQDDRLFGGNGDDTMSGGSGDDKMFGGADDDVMTGDAGEDRLKGGDGNDDMSGGADDDRLQGGEGNDTMAGDGGSDKLFGNNGDDVMDGGAGNDRVDGGDGNDNVSGGSGDDYVVGNSGDDTLSGGSGDDTLRAGQGNDVLTDGAGDDLMRANSGDDALTAENGSDRLDGGSGNDVLTSISDANGGSADDELSGDSGLDDFVFELQVDTYAEVAETYIDGNGTVDWDALVASETDDQFWVEGIGNDTITDFDSAEDTLTIKGTNLETSVELVDGDSVITVYYVDHDNGTAMLEVGTITVEGVELDENDIALVNDYVDGDQSNIANLAIDPDTPATAQEFLEGADGIGFSVTMVSTSSGYNNTIGAYEVDADGNLVDVQILFAEDDAGAGQSIDLTDVAAGNDLRFFIVQDGGAWASALLETDTLAFTDGLGGTANLDDGDDLLLTVNGVDAGLTFYLGLDAAQNADGFDHFQETLSDYGSILTMGIEDLTGGGVNNYQDVVLEVDTFIL